MDHVIEISHLTKSFGSIKAVDDVTLKIPKGQFFGLLGPNGSGKTTIIKCLTGQIKPTSGRVMVQGIDASSQPIKVREISGIIPEQENPPSFLTAEEYLFFVGKIRKLQDIKRRADHWMDYLGFADQKDVLCKDLSRGTRQKLMFSQAFLEEPAVAFIDEPLVNLDPITQDKVERFLKGYVKEGNNVFFSTHVLKIAEELCTSIAIINRGKIIYHGKTKKRLDRFFLGLVNNA